MKPEIGRRHFLQLGGFALTGAAVSSLSSSAPQVRAAAPGGRIKKAVGWEMIREELSAEDKFRLVKDVGFEGVEINFIEEGEFSAKSSAEEIKAIGELARQSGIAVSTDRLNL